MATAPAATTAIATDQPQQTQQTQQPAGRDWLPEDLRASPSLEKFKTPGDVAKSYLELEKMASGSVRIPKPDAKPEEVREFHKKLGVPESPDKYEFKRPEMPADIEYNEELETGYKAVAHKAGLSNPQAEGLLQWYNDLQIAHFSKQKEALTTAQNELKKEWGANFERQMTNAEKAVAAYADDEIKGIFKDRNLLRDNPFLAKLLAQVGESLQEDDVVKPDKTPVTTDDESSIRQKIEAMYDAKHPYMDERADPKLRLTAQNDMFKLQTQLAALTGKDLTRQ